MRAITVTISALLILLMAPSSQALGPVTVYGGLGFSRLSSPDSYKADYANGVHISVGLGFDMAPNLEIVPRYERHSFSAEKTGSLPKMNISMYGADAHLSFGPPSLGFTPVLLGGIGLATNEKGSNLGGVALDVTEKDTDFYYDLGGGIEFRRFTFHIRYVSASANGTTISYLPFTVGVKF